MNFQSVLEELNRLYEEDATETVEAPEEEVAEEQALTEAAEEEVEVVEEPEEEEPAVEEEELVEEEAQLVLECANCGALIIKAEAAVEVTEGTSLANAGEVCQYCEAEEGYKILGVMAPYGVAEEEPADVEAKEEETAEDEVVEESLLDVDLPISVDIK